MATGKAGLPNGDDIAAQLTEGLAQTPVEKADAAVELLNLRRENARLQGELVEWQSKYLEDRVHSTQVIQALGRPLINQINQQRLQQIANREGKQ